MCCDSGFSITYLSSSVVRNGNDFALVYIENGVKTTLIAEAYRTSKTSTKYEIAVPSSFRREDNARQLSEYGKNCLMRIRSFIDNEAFEFRIFGVPDIALDRDYGLPGWSAPDSRSYEQELLVIKEKNQFVIRHGGLSKDFCSVPQCSNHALRGERLCVDHLCVR